MFIFKLGLLLHSIVLGFSLNSIFPYRNLFQSSLKLISRTMSTAITPWERDLNSDLRSWIGVGHRGNVPGNIFDAMDHKNLLAMIIIQDCNIGGQYYRYFWYESDHADKRFCTVIHKWFLDTAEDDGAGGLRDGMVVTVCGKRKFTVKIERPFVALLLPVS
jgi:hypothetical protein